MPAPATAETTHPTPRVTARLFNTSPILRVTGRTELAIVAGTTVEIDGRTYVFETDVAVDTSDLVPGADYGIKVDAYGKSFATPVDANPLSGGYFSGFHFAPGGNASARGGGDAIPVINPLSIWDVGFRPACPDPRGMTLVTMADGSEFWSDIYLLNADHKTLGTSRFGAKIADGRSLEKLDYASAAEIYAGHGKRLMTYAEFRSAAFGVTERSAASRDPDITGLDAERTSQFGLMQAAGNLWVWGTDGDSDDPRPSIFGGSWFDGVNAGSRCACLDNWPEGSFEFLSARGACGHLAPA